MRKIKGKSDSIDYRMVQINIKVFFEDNDHFYQELYMVTNAEILTNTIIDSRVSLSQSDSYGDNVYNDVINLAFRPKVVFEMICSSIMSYIGCHLHSPLLVNHIEENPSVSVYVVAHINVDDNDDSSVDVLPIFDNFAIHDPYFDLVNSKDTSLCLTSRLISINVLERVVLFDLVEKQLDSQTGSYMCTDSQLWENFKSLTDEMINSGIRLDEITRDTLSGVIDTLLFFDLIDLDQKDSFHDESGYREHYFIFSVRDINLYPKLFQILSDEMAA